MVASPSPPRRLMTVDHEVRGLASGARRTDRALLRAKTHFHCAGHITWCTNRFETPWPSGVKMMARQEGPLVRLSRAEWCRGRQPMQITATAFLHPVAHTDASCARV